MSIKLSDKRKSWVGSRTVTLNGLPLNHNAAIARWYSKELKRLVRSMSSEVYKKTIKLFKRVPVTPISAMDDSIASQARILMNELMNWFSGEFSKAAEELSSKLIDKTLKISESNISSSLRELSGGISIKAGVYPTGLTDIIKASISENVSLIKSIPQKYFNDVYGSVMRSITSGRGLKDLDADIKKYANMTLRRAELLALDQTRKAYSSINSARLNSLGVKKFKWLHSGGGREPRASHLRISGEVFSFENLEREQAALNVPKDDRGLPGYPVNCKCVMIPVIEFKEGENEDS